MTNLARYLTLGLSLTTTACGVDADLSNAEQAVDRVDRPLEQVLCTANACLIHDARDSDGDGVSDMDEVAAGTDPHDPWSRPYVGELLDLVGFAKLPSFAIGHSAVVLLPTRRPDGSPIFGGREGFPARESTLKRLGITSEMLGRLDLTQGLTLTGIHDSKGGPSLNVNGMRWGLVSQTNGTNPTTAIARALGMSSDRSTVTGVSNTSVSGGGGLEFGTLTVQLNSGGIANVSYQASSTQVKVNVENRDTPDGAPYGSTSSTTDTDPNGITVEHTTTETTGTCRVGCTSYTSKTETTVTTSSDGGTRATETTRTRTDTSRTGEQTTTTSSSTTVCTGDDCVTKDDTEQHTCADAGGSGCGTTEEDDSTALTNPDYVDGSPSPEYVNAVLARLGSTVLVVNTYGDHKTYEYDPNGRNNKYGPIALYTDDATNQPLVFHIPAVATPEYDPNLPHTDIDNPDQGLCTYCAQ